LFSAALNWAQRELEWEGPNPFQGRRQREPAGRNRWLSPREAEALKAEMARPEGFEPPTSASGGHVTLSITF
jgi:hypothetical protein